MLLVSCAVLCLACLVFIAINYGYLAAARCSFFFALLIPTWIGEYLGSAIIDMRVICFTTAAFCYVICSDPKIRWRLCVSDFLMAAFAVLIAYSKHLSGDFSPTTVLDITFQWIVPYVFGRLMANLPNPVMRMSLVVVAAAALLAVLVTFEALTHVNIFNTVVGRPGSVEAEVGQRWGLRRADGVLIHPISMGMMIAALLPWTLVAASAVKRRAIQPLGPLWFWGFAPLLVAFSILFPLSRGPILIMLGTIATIVFLKYRAVRLPIGLAGMALAALLMFRSDRIINVLQETAQDTHSATIAINGVTHQYTGTSHRYLQMLVYREAITEAGMFGFGRFAMSRPQHMQYIEPHLRPTFLSVDNHYLVTILNHGYVGLTLFLLIVIYAVYAIFSLWLRGGGTFAAAMLGWLLAATVMLSTVWLDNDISFPFFFNVGFMAGWWTLVRRQPNPQAAAIDIGTACADRDPQGGPRRSRTKSKSTRKHMDRFKLPNPSRQTMNSPIRYERPEATLPPAPFVPPAANSNYSPAFLIRRWLPIGLIAAAIAIPAAYVLAPKFASDRWVHTTRLAFRLGRLNVDSYRPPELSELLPTVADRSAVNQAIQGRADADAVFDGVAVLSTPGTQHMSITLKWKDREQGRVLLEAIVIKAIEASSELRKSRLLAAQTDMQSEMQEVAAQIAPLEKELLEFQVANKTNAVAEDLRLLVQEIRSLEVELLSARAERKGIDAQMAHRRVQAEQNSAIGASEDLLLASIARRRELQRLIEQQDLKRDRSKAKLRYDNQVREVERKRSLNQRKLLSDAELQHAELELELYEIEVGSPSEGLELEKELNELEEKLAYAESVNRNDFFQLVAEEIANRERVASLESRLSENRAEEIRLRELAPIEEKIKGKLAAAEFRMEQLVRASHTFRSFENSSVNQLVIDQPVALDNPPMVSDQKKVLAALTLGIFGVISSPFLLIDSIRLQRRRQLEELTNIGLGQLNSSPHRMHYLTHQDGTDMQSAPPADIRRMINQLISVMPDSEYTLLFASMQNEPPSMALMFDVSRCFARHGRNVLLLIVDQPKVDVVSGEVKLRLQDTAYANQLPDSFEIEHVDCVQAAVSDLEKHRRTFDLVIIAAGFDASESHDLDLLSFYADGVVVSDLGSGKHLRSRVKVIRQLNNCEGNILGLMS